MTTSPSEPHHTDTKRAEVAARDGWPGQLNTVPLRHGTQRVPWPPDVAAFELWSGPLGGLRLQLMMKLPPQYRADPTAEECTEVLGITALVCHHPREFPTDVAPSGERWRLFTSCRRRLLGLIPLPGRAFLFLDLGEVENRKVVVDRGGLEARPDQEGGALD